MLNTKKLVHKECVMYRTVSNQMPKSLRSYDMIILFTPSGVESLLKNYPNFKQGKLRIGCWGNATAKAIHEHELRLDLEAPSAEAPSMTAGTSKKTSATKKSSSKKTVTTKKKATTEAKEEGTTKKVTSKGKAKTGVAIAEKNISEPKTPSKKTK